MDARQMKKTVLTMIVLGMLSAGIGSVAADSGNHPGMDAGAPGGVSSIAAADDPCYGPGGLICPSLCVSADFDCGNGCLLQFTIAPELIDPIHAVCDPPAI